jgi:FK506-binding nuclear protein
MAALDPTAKPKDPKQPLRSTLKIMRRPLQNPDFDEDDEDDEETDSESDSESEEEAPSVKGKKGSKKSAAPAKKAAEEDEDEDDLDLSDDDEYEIEEFTICTLDTERVCLIGDSSLGRNIDNLPELPTTSRHCHWRRRGVLL